MTQASIAEYMQQVGKNARIASTTLAAAEAATKNKALNLIADLLEEKGDYLKSENARDLEAGAAKGLDAALLDRLELTDPRVATMAEGLRQIAALADPVGEISTGLPGDCVQVIETTDRAAVGELLRLKDSVDVIIPRGGKGLIERVSNDSLIPVIKHLDGICHVYIDDAADEEKALAVAVNSKTQRYGTCNTMETLLVAESISESILPKLSALYAKHDLEIRGCKRTQAILVDCASAEEVDWHTEYLAPILSIRMVDDLDHAIQHINQYSSQHTDSIVTENFTKARRFLREVDSASVMVNASTRFADGFEYGLGAEIGISTDKLHARGPVGLEGLTSVKYVVLGDGHIRQ